LKITSINVASPTLVSLGKATNKVKSGIFKNPISQPILLDYLGFESDGVGDSRIHGGKDMAVCVYCVDHFSYWEEKYQRKILPGSFGENLSVSGMSEEIINIGDIFEVGQTQLEVSQARQPCHKLNKIFNDQSMACDIKKTGFSGYYLRVLKPGLIQPGTSIKRIYEGSYSIEKANALLRKGGANIAYMKELIDLPALSDGWRVMFQKRVEKYG
jgi:MOSC domain-containing protein YiiM